MYKAPYMKSLAEMTTQQIRLGLQGPPKVGKTWAALTFPNPVVLNLDRGLGAHIARADVCEVPFYNDSYVDSLCPKISPFYEDFLTREKKTRPSNRKDALLKWLYSEGIKLSSDQTLIVDGGTRIQAAYHAQYWTNPSIDREGKIKPYEEYKLKIAYFSELCICLTALPCAVVYICHETVDRDDKGNLNGKIRPLLSGQFCDEIQGNFTDWFRCLAFAKPTNTIERENAKTFFGWDTAYLDYVISKSTTQTMYVWQTQSDALAVCGTSTLIGAPKYILADYSSFAKYQRKQTTQTKQ